MKNSQVPRWRTETLALHTERLGSLPLINHVLGRLRLEEHLERFVPTTERRVRLPYAKGLAVLVRSILIEREPIYRQAETVATFVPDAFGLRQALVPHLSDDAVGRALDRLYDADRAALLSEVVIASVEAFGVALDEVHNDATTVRLCGQYRQARGRALRGKRAPWITYGYSKDHRPDLKQLLLRRLSTKLPDFFTRLSFPRHPPVSDPVAGSAKLLRSASSPACRLTSAPAALVWRLHKAACDPPEWRHLHHGAADPA